MLERFIEKLRSRRRPMETDDIGMAAVVDKVPGVEDYVNALIEASENVIVEAKESDKPKIARRILPEDIEPFRIGTLQQAVQVYYHLVERGFTFADLVEYVAYSTVYQTQFAEFAATKRGDRKKEPPAMIALTREERKKFKRGIRR